MVALVTGFIIATIGRLRRRPPPTSGSGTLTDRQLTDRVAALMRDGGWRQVTVTAAMGHLGTDVVGMGADGRRWLMRCHRDAARLAPADVHRFADTARNLRRGDVTMLVTAGPVSAPVLHAAVQAGVTLVDGESLAWWSTVQNPARP